MAAERLGTLKSLLEALCDDSVTSFNFLLKCCDNPSLKSHVVLKWPPNRDLEMKDRKRKKGSCVVLLYSNRKPYVQILISRSVGAGGRL